MTSWDPRRPELVVAQLQAGGWLEKTQSLMVLVRHQSVTQDVIGVAAAWTTPPLGRELQREKGEAALASLGLGDMTPVPEDVLRVPVSVRGGPAILLEPDLAISEVLRWGWIQPYAMPLVITPAGWAYGWGLAAHEPAAFTA